MHVLVVLAGVADPRKPLSPPASGDWRDVVGHSVVASALISFKLSPFDEAALETALKLRHAGAATRITAVVTDGANDLALMRAVAALKPDEVCGAPGLASLRWDPVARARALARTLAPFADARLVLVGREHGDADDGSLPGMLADAMGHAFVGLALSVSGTDEGITVERLAGESTASAELALPAVVSMTNDKSNRLRHPLLKNVMQAKQQTFGTLDSDVPAALRVQAARVQPAASRRNTAEPCRMLQGSLPEQARQLAEFLQPWCQRK